jgi:hypothetical protein
MTPEGEIKREIDRVLSVTADSRPMWWFKPVQSGRGKRALDYIGCVNGKFFSIEAKREGETLTSFQRHTSCSILNAGGKVFSVSSQEGLNAFCNWLWAQ